MEKITHISVGRDDEGDPQGPSQPVYVDPPEPDILDEEPFASGRHRIERTPEGDDEKPRSTLWSWTEGG
jgi:hypothetical protein